jgi:hypothetical protein
VQTLAEPYLQHEEVQMELVLGIAGELQPGPYVDCPEEGCAYTLDGWALMRHRRGADLVFGEERPIAVDPELDALEYERPRLRRIERMLAESIATARLASHLVVYVPDRGDVATEGILAGSGIIGSPLPRAESVVVYYEGARYGQPEMRRLADRVFYAHGRLLNQYPTVARMAVRRDSLVEVGTFDPTSGTITVVDAPSEAAIAAWLGTRELDPIELIRSGGTLMAPGGGE